MSVSRGGVSGGFLGWGERRGADVVGREDGLVYGLVLLRERDGRDHRGLDGAYRGGAFAEVAGEVVEVEAQADEDCRDQDVEQRGVDEAAAELVVVSEGCGAGWLACS